MKKGIIVLALLTIPVGIDASVRHVKSTGEFDSLIASGPVVVKASAVLCGPCKAIKAPFEDLAADAEFRDIQFVGLDIDKDAAIADRYGIQSVPTFLFIKNGQVVYRKTGAPSPFKSHMKNLINQHLRTVAPATPASSSLPAPEATEETGSIWQSVQDWFTSVWEAIQGWFK